MEREEERERRRLRDRQRRQSMTKEQRERHLARRRRNYQLRRLRTANSPIMPLTQSTTADETLATTSLDHNLLHHVHESSQIVQGFPRRLRLNIIKRLARNLASPMSVPPGNNRVAAEFISGLSGEIGSTSNSKPLRLNSVKRLARSLSFPSEKTATQNSHNVNEIENGKSIRVAVAPTSSKSFVEVRRQAPLMLEIK